jgi:lysine 2,3-aminomutase
MSPRAERWREVRDEHWQDWRWQLRHRLRSADEIAAVVPLSEDEERAIADLSGSFRTALTPYYASLIDPSDSECPVRRQAIPHADELASYPGMLEDPLAEEANSPVDGVVHRYPDRALIYASHDCPVYCRHCTRKRKVSDPRSAPARGDLEGAVQYVAAHEEVRDVLVSGGDPLCLSDDTIDWLLAGLLSIPHVDLVRVCTRAPVTLPQRVDNGLLSVLGRHTPIYLHTHFNHPKECTQESAAALEALAGAGCVLGNQSVLLKGVNDTPETIAELNRWLLRHRCRPHYLIHCDSAPGVGHFRTRVEDGVRLLEALQGHISGLAVPRYVVDLPGGGGKVPVVPDYLLASGPERTVFRSYRGRAHVLENTREAPEQA